MKDNQHRTCELCDQRAAVYCPSDSAFLCFLCDSSVHSANFLVARHLRYPIRSSCDDDHDNESWSSLLSFDTACVSTTDHRSSGTTTTYRKTDLSRVTTKRRVIKRAAETNSADVTFLRWWRELGLLMIGDVDHVVTSASQALGFCMARMPGVSMRVSMAAAFWFGVRGCGGERRRRREVTWREVRRVEEITGVPARMLLAVDAKLRRELRGVRRGNKAAEMEEGWAES